MNIRNKKLVGAIIGGAVAVGFFAASAFNLFSSWQLKLADNLYTQSNPSKKIIIVAIDDKSLNSGYGLGDFSSWKRSYYAQVLDNINKFNPKVVGFDIFFADSKDPADDQILADSLSKTKNPILIFFNNGFTLNPKGYFEVSGKKDTKLPLAEFSNISNVNLSVANVIPDKDSVIRAIVPGIYDNSRKIFDENLTFAVVRKFLELKPINGLPAVKDSTYLFDANAKNTAIPLENGRMLINFFSNRKSGYKTVSFLDAYQNNFGNLKPEDIKDGIVLIGSKTKLIRDDYFTPVDSVNPMPGVEIHANAIQTILEQKFLRNMTAAEKAVLIFLLAIAGAFVFMFTKIRWSVLTLVAGLGVYSALAPLAFKFGLILDLVHPYLTLVTVFVAVYMYRYLTEFKQRAQLESAFSKYVNPAIVEQLSAHPGNLKLGGEKREITVIFTDIAHFTSISEKLKPESLVALLNEYFEAMSEVILSEGGTVDKFEGDAIMAFFGAPLPQADHAVRACNAALKMREKLGQLIEKWKAENAAAGWTEAQNGIGPLPGGEPKPMIDFRCGISSGEVIVGNMGSQKHLEYTVMGDIVNLGSRLEGANKKYDTRIMMSEMTWLNGAATAGAETVTSAAATARVCDQFETRELDTIKVVGKQQPIKVYELLNYKGRLVPDAAKLLQLYNEGISLYHQRKFADALAKFTDLLKTYPEDGPSKLYRQRCEVLKDFPPAQDWDGVFEMGSK